MIVPGLLLYVVPLPGMNPAQEHVFAFFVATIIALVAQPVRMAVSVLLAMTLLAVGYLGVQYMLALGRVAFLPALGVVAIAEIALLGGLGITSLWTFAAIVLGLQAAAAISVLTIGLLSPVRRTATAAR